MKQWKRLAALSSAIVMAAATLTYFPSDTLQNIRLEISASAEDASAVTWTKTESDGLTWTLYEDGTLNISGTGEMRGYNAYSIKSPACDNSNIKNVVIEDGITSIGNNAFYGCSLTNIRIPGSVTSIGKYALDYCMSLTSVTIPGSVSSIGEYAFSDCRNLTDATILDGVTSIENRAFCGCSRLTSVTIPNSVTNIGESAFWNCNKLTSVTIPDGVTSIEDHVFSSCYSLTSITIPNSVTSIGNYVFDGCSSLTSITIPDGVISIGNFAFSGCNELTSITIPDSVTSIGDSAFEECRILTSISIPDSVTSIGSSVFNDCFFLETISLSCKSTLKRSDFEGKSKFVSYTPHTLKKVEVKAETCTENGNKEYWTCEHCGKYFLSDDTNPETAKAVELSETVIPASHKLTKVEAKAPTCTEDGNKEYWTCEHCGKYFLSDDANPETAKAVEQSEFIIPALNHKNAIIQNASEPTETAPGYSGDRYCPDCDTVFEKGYTYWNEGNLTWKLYADGTLTISGTGAMKNYDYNDNPSPVYNNSNVKKVVIEDGVTSIGNSAFNECISLTSITIPDSVTSIGTYAFSGCRSLTSITIPDSVTSIGAYAFQSCSNLTSITIPDSVTSIGASAFNSCSGLTSITIPDSVTSIGNFAFSYCISLTSITIPDSVTSIGSYAFYNCKNLTTISLSCKSSLKKSDFGDKADLVSYTNQHPLTKTAAKAATCSESGNKEYWTCEHCGKYFLSDDSNPETAKAVELSETVISASHKLTKVEAKDATCTEDGNKEYWTCEHCGKYFLSDDTNPETAKAVELSETILPAIQHKNAELRNSSEPTETAPGYSGDLYCPDCDKVVEKGYTYWNEGNLTWKLYEDGTLNISGTGAMKDYNDDDNPSPVYQNSNVKKVVIEKGVTSIGNYAFSGCLGLKSITIPDGITSIGDHAFDSCINLRSITLPDSITSIGMWAFYNCWNVSSIIIPDGVTSIEDFTFNSCISLTSITIPNSVTNIKSSAFHNCADLTSITIPDSVTSIGYAAFSNCDSLQTISLGCGSALKKSDFGDQADLVSYTNQHFLTKTEAKAKTCTEDGNKEYWTCEHCGKYFLSDDTNPETAKAVEQSETIIPASHELTKVEAKDATCTESGNKEYWTCEHCGKYFLSDDTNPETAKAVELSETILPAIQHKNAELRNASEPTETSPGYSGDLYCPDCDKVLEKGYTYWNEGNLTWKLDADGTLTISGTGAMKDYDYYYNNPSPAYNNSNVKKVVIEDGVTSIESGAFADCSSLTDIVIPNSVTSIGDFAFDWCSNLSSITLSNNITSIGTFAFNGCSSLTSITIPDSVTSIGSFAFNHCNSLQTISLGCGSALKRSDFGKQGDFVSYASHILKKTAAKAATCTEDGNKEYWTCEHCGKYFLSDDTNPETAKAVEQSETVIPASHKLTKVDAKDATCSESGNKEYWTCEHCGKYFLSDDANPETAKAVELSETVIPASHKLTKVEAKDATCTENGNKAYWTCEHCKKYFLSDDTNPETAKAVEQSETVIPASHKLTKVEAKAATCTEDGNIEYWTCEHCKKYFLSDDTNPATAKAVELSETVIPALVQVATATTPIKCVYGQDMSKIDLRDYVKNTDVVGEVTVKVATGSTLPDGMKLDGSNLSGKPAKAYEDGKEVTFTFTAENGSTANLTLLFLVEKADPTVEVSVSGDSHTEGDLVSELKLILSENSTKGVVELVSEIKALVAGKNTFTWKFTPEDENNYNMVTGTVVVNAQTTTTTTTTTKATTTTTKATTTTKPSKTTTTKATTTTKPNKTTTTKVTTTTKPNKTTTTKVTTTTKPSKTTTTNATTTTKPSKTTTTKVTTTTKPNKTTTTKATTTTKPSKTTTTKATTTTKPSKTTTTNATTTTKPSKTTTTKVTTTTKPSKATTTKVTTTTTTAIPSYGDVNLDGKVDIVDAIFLNKYLATLIQFSDAQVANADCYQDGVLNDQDTTALMQFIILLIDDLPVQPTEK